MQYNYTPINSLLRVTELLQSTVSTYRRHHGVFITINSLLNAIDAYLRPKWNIKGM